MKTTTTIIALSAALLTAFNACKKDDGGSTNNSNLNAKEQMIVGSWRVVSKNLVYYKSNGGTDTLSNLNDCEKDDTYTFSADKTYIVTNGADKCQTSGATYDNSFHWRVIYDSSLDYAWAGPAIHPNHRTTGRKYAGCPGLRTA